MSKKDEYIKARDEVLEAFDQLKTLISHDTPLKGDRRKEFMEKFVALDRVLIDKLDHAAHEYSKEIKES